MHLLTMTEKQEETYNNLLKIPGIYRPPYPNYEDLIYLTVIGRGITAGIQIHKSGDFSFFIPDRGRRRYIKDVDAFIERLSPPTVVGFAFHLDKLYIIK